MAGSYTEDIYGIAMEEKTRPEVYSSDLRFRSASAVDSAVMDAVLDSVSSKVSETIVAAGKLSVP